MKIGRFSRHLGYTLVAAFVVFGISQPGVFAQSHDSHMTAAPHGPETSEQKARTNAFVQLVRDVTRRFLDPEVAKAEGYLPQFGCVSGSSEGAMGVHFVNGRSCYDKELDPSRPELLVYEPLPNNRFQLVAADYLVPSAAWNGNPKNSGPPILLGQLFHLFESPNRFGLPEFFTLHVWAWKDNPQGTFANWNPNVSCDAYNPQS